VNKSCVNAKSICVTITNTADDLYGGTNIDDFERP